MSGSGNEHKSNAGPSPGLCGGILGERRASALFSRSRGQLSLHG